jgi:hypothetical protein
VTNSTSSHPKLSGALPMARMMLSGLASFTWST